MIAVISGDRVIGARINSLFVDALGGGRFLTSTRALTTTPARAKPKPRVLGPRFESARELNEVLIG